MEKYKITFETWNKLAEVYEDKFLDIDLYNDSYDAFCALLKKNARILEIGCGPGNITQYLLKKRPNFSILGTDVAPTMIAAAKKNNPTAEFQRLDARELDQLTEYFDAILCGFCAPYLSLEDCQKLINDSHALLKDQGVFYISMIEGNPENSGFQTGSSGDQVYVYYHSEKDISKAMETAQFTILETFRKLYAKSNGEKETHLIYLVKK